MLPVELSSQWGLEKHTWFDITSNGYFVFLNTLVILLNYREAMVSELELLFFYWVFNSFVFFQGIFTVKIIKNLFSDILWGVTFRYPGIFSRNICSPSCIWIYLWFIQNRITICGFWRQFLSLHGTKGKVSIYIMFFEGICQLILNSKLRMYKFIAFTRENIPFAVVEEYTLNPKFWGTFYSDYFQTFLDLLTRQDLISAEVDEVPAI